MSEYMESFTYHYVAVPPTKQIGPHIQNDWELSLVVYGKGQRITGDCTEDFISGDLMLIPPNITHCWYFAKDYTDIRGNILNITLLFPTDTIRQLKETFPQIKYTLEKLLMQKDALSFPAETGKPIADKLKEMRLASDAKRCLIFMELILLLCEDIDKGIKTGGRTRKNPVRDKLMAIDAYVACNFSREISISEIASHVGMNNSSFCAFFKRHRQETFVTFLNKYRLDKAAYLIRISPPSTPIMEICYQCGFQTVSHFNHLFKKHFGVAPKQTR